MFQSIPALTELQELLARHAATPDLSQQLADREVRAQLRKLRRQGLVAQA
jgi:chromosome condensin MukBEF MukE localization factor